MTVEKPPDEVRTEYCLLPVFRPDLPLYVIPLCYKAPTPHPRLTPPIGRDIHEPTLPFRSLPEGGQRS